MLKTANLDFTTTSYLPHVMRTVEVRSLFNDDMTEKSSKSSHLEEMFSSTYVSLTGANGSLDGDFSSVSLLCSLTLLP